MAKDAFSLYVPMLLISVISIKPLGHISATPISPYMASPTRPQPPPTEQQILNALREERERERAHLLPYDNVGVCGRFTSVFQRNLALILLLVLGIVGLVCFFHPQFLLLSEKCYMHHDEHLGKLWLECPEAVRKVFGPRRY